MKTQRIVIIAVGGQGNLLSSRLLGEAALSKGIPFVISEIHGMAQRGGIVESAVLMGDVSSPIVSAGESDVFLGFEPLRDPQGARKMHPENRHHNQYKTHAPVYGGSGAGNISSCGCNSWISSGPG